MNDEILYYLIVFSFVMIAGILGLGIAILGSKINENKKEI